MACYHPLKAFVYGVDEKTNKNKVKVTSFKADHLVKYYNNNNDSLRPCFEERSLCPYRDNCKEKVCKYQCIEHWWNDHSSERWLLYHQSHPYVQYIYADYMTIPCGQCAGCRIDKSREWANRMMLEMPYSTGSWFITLTYDDDFLCTPERYSLDLYDDDGNSIIHCWKEKTQSVYEDYEGRSRVSYSLSEQELTNFIKRLRKEFDVYELIPVLDDDGVQKVFNSGKKKGMPRWKRGSLLDSIRYYCCGEYGSEKFRPHYHGIFWNLVLDPEKDLILDRVTKEGFPLYRCPRIERIWPFGFVYVCNVTWQTCAYVARYVQKKWHWKYRSTYDFFNIEPEFSTMSRRNGLGYEWFQDHTEEAYKSYIITVSSSEGSLRFKPPGYFDDLYDGLDPTRMAEIKENRRIMAENMVRNKLMMTDKGYLEYLATEESNFRQRINKLGRKDCFDA